MRKWIPLPVHNLPVDTTSCNGCDACGLRCAAGIRLTRPEYAHLREYIANASAAERDYIARVTAQNKEVALGDGVTATMCRYRDVEAGRCAVYPARPLVCRLLGYVEWMPCPIEKIERTLTREEQIALLTPYYAQERRTFEEWEDFFTTETQRHREDSER